MKLIIDFKENDKIKQNFLISNVTKALTTKGANYFNLTLQDSSGSIEAKKWEINDGDELIFQVGNIVNVEGDILSYRGILQFRISNGTIVDDKDIDYTQFISSSPVSRDELQKELFSYIEKINNKDIKIIVEEVLKNNYISFSVYPAASKIHHEYASGLMHHTVSMLKLAEAICDLYPILNRDLLYGGVVLHDIGKTIELSGPVLTKYTLEGRLVGHISIIQAQIKMIANKYSISGEIPTLLQHLVLSHHGKYEFGSPVLPMIKEAEILTYIDNIDARMNIMAKVINSVPAGEFTPRAYALEDRIFYRPLLDEEDKENNDL